MDPRCEQHLQFSCLLRTDESLEILSLRGASNTVARKNIESERRGEDRVKGNSQISRGLSAFGRRWAGQPSDPLGRAFLLSVPQDGRDIAAQSRNIPGEGNVRSRCTIRSVVEILLVFTNQLKSFLLVVGTNRPPIRMPCFPLQPDLDLDCLWFSLVQLLHNHVLV